MPLTLHIVAVLMAFCFRFELYLSLLKMSDTKMAKLYFNFSAANNGNNNTFDALHGLIIANIGNHRFSIENKKSSIAKIRLTCLNRFNRLTNHCSIFCWFFPCFSRYDSSRIQSYARTNFQWFLLHFTVSLIIFSRSVVDKVFNSFALCH